MTLKDIRFIIEDRFLDIVTEILEPSPDKLRLIVKDGSFIDIRVSQKIKNRFDFHWERRHQNYYIGSQTLFQRFQFVEVSEREKNLFSPKV